MGPGDKERRLVILVHRRHPLRDGRLEAPVALEALQGSLELSVGGIASTGLLVVLAYVRVIELDLLEPFLETSATLWIRTRLVGKDVLMALSPDTTVPSTGGNFDHLPVATVHVVASGASGNSCRVLAPEFFGGTVLVAHLLVVKDGAAIPLATDATSVEQLKCHLRPSFPPI